MTSTPVSSPRDAGLSLPQWQRFGLVFAGIAAVLLAGYMIFLRSDYALLFSDLSAQEASLVVSKLDKMEVRYRIGDGGRTIEVPAREADEVRLKITSSTSAVSNLVGFELFNESDMGMTEFAQKIKYQRAIQGELARSILLIEGIENARVHIAIPERAAFRANQAAATASVTLVLRRGAILADDRVDAIRYMIAAAVPGLAPDAVTVLDQNGRLIAAARPAADTVGLSSALDEGASDAGAGAQLTRLVDELLPGTNAGAVLSLDAALPGLPAEAGAVGALPQPRSAAQLVVITDSPVAATSREAVQAGARAVIAPVFGPAEFEINVLFLTRQAAAPIAAGPFPSAASAEPLEGGGAPMPIPRHLVLPVALGALGLVGAGLILVAAAWFVRQRRQRFSMNGPDRRAFAELLTSQIAFQKGGPE